VARAIAMTIPEEKRAGYISLKEASERFGYSQDYLGQLIRKGKLDGKLVYSHVAWVTTPEAVEQYINNGKDKKKKTKEGLVPTTFSDEVNTPTAQVEDGGMMLADDDAPSSRTATFLIVVFRVLLFLAILSVVFVFYLLTTAFGEEVQIGSRVARASVSFAPSSNLSHHE
jgi:hypothetical protein